MTADAGLINDVVDRLRPLQRDLNLAWWESNTHASPEVERRRTELELQLRAVLGDPQLYGSIKAALDAEGNDASTTRQLEYLFNLFTPHQVPEDLRRQIV